MGDIIDDRPGLLDSLDAPTRNQLIQAFAKARHAKLYRAPVAARRKLDAALSLAKTAATQQCPYLNLDSPVLLQELTQRGDQWWAVKAEKGAGVDW